MSISGVAGLFTIAGLAGLVVWIIAITRPAFRRNCSHCGSEKVRDEAGKVKVYDGVKRVEGIPIAFEPPHVRHTVTRVCDVCRTRKTVRTWTTPLEV